MPDGPGRFAQGSSCPALLRMPLGPVGLRVPDYHRLWSDFPDTFRSPQGCHIVVLLPRGGAQGTTRGLGYSPVARHYWGNHCCFLFLRVLRCFSSPRWPHHTKVVMAGLQPAGLSHSDARGSMGICPSPRIFAAYRVLHRLREPRHPPFAFACFPSTPAPSGGHGDSYFLMPTSRRSNAPKGTAFDSCFLD